MRRKNLTLAIGILAVFALASIGFASWIITNPNSGTEAEGTIVVDDVTSKVFEIVTTWDSTSNGVIVFGTPEDYEEQDTDWLTNSDIAHENLEAELTISFSKKDNVNLETILTDTPISISLSVLSDGAEMEETAASELFSGLGLPEPVITIKNAEGNYVEFDGEIDYSDLDADAKCVIKVTFAWGSKTNYENPYTYYNNIEFGTETEEEDEAGEKMTIEVVAEKYLKQLYTDFSGITYKLTLSDK